MGANITSNIFQCSNLAGKSCKISALGELWIIYKYKISEPDNVFLAMHSQPEKRCIFTPKTLLSKSRSMENSETLPTGYKVVMRKQFFCIHK